MTPKVSIIIRTKNEERWIRFCLDMVFRQTYKDFEVIIVDNKSTDKTLDKIKDLNVVVKTIDRYTPGFSLNEGIRASKGEILVFLSGHCVPEDEYWLENLIKEFNQDEKIAGVYGRQLPMSFTSPEDKRDLYITFGLDRKIQIKDSFFHNASSAILRSLWEEVPFDEEVTNIEDRIWASQVLKRDYKIIYTPESRVYHHHGIHHSGDPNRALNTLKVMNKIKFQEGNLSLDQYKIMSIIPVKGNFLENELFTKSLKNTINYSLDNELIHETVVLTDNEEVASFAKSCGAKVPFLREESLSSEYIDLSMVYQRYIDDLIEDVLRADLVVSLEPQYPIRPVNLIRDMVSEIINNGFDSVVSGYDEYDALWSIKDNMRIDHGNVSRDLKSPVFVSCKGLGMVVHPEIIRQGEFFGSNCGFHRLDKMYTAFNTSNLSKIEFSDQFLNSISELKK